MDPFLCGSWIRKRALAECMDHIHYEDENTRYVDLGPDNKVGGGFTYASGCSCLFKYNFSFVVLNKVGAS